MKSWALVAAFAVAASSFAMVAPPAEVVVRKGGAGECKKEYFFRELPIFRDPSFFLVTLSEYYADPRVGRERLDRETTKMGTLLGSVHVQSLGDPEPFRSVGPIAERYFADEPRLRGQGGAALKVRPVMLCGENQPYRDTFGLVIEADLKQARLPEGSGRPPSTPGNEILELEN